MLAKVIPFRNAPALIGYYCAVFGLIPVIGAFLGLVALLSGFLGLKKVGQLPEAGGKVHAWIAIVLGLLEFGSHVALVVWLSMH